MLFPFVFLISSSTLPKENLKSHAISLTSLLLPNLDPNKAKTRIEICIISARGVGRSSSLWKPQWFAVAWIDPDNKLLHKDWQFGKPKPTMGREPIFLWEKLQGTATIMLKEFFMKFGRDDTSRSGVEETVSFQLRKRNFGKPQGFVDVSFHVFKKEGVYSHSGICLTT